jgi:hypothetical protein
MPGKVGLIDTDVFKRLDRLALLYLQYPVNQEKGVAVWKFGQNFVYVHHGM